MDVFQDHTETNVAFIPITLDDFGLTPQEFRIYCHLARRSNKAAHGAWPSIASISQNCGIGTDTVRYVLECLEAFLMIERKPRKGKSDMIVLRAPSKWEKIDRPQNRKNEVKRGWDERNLDPWSPDYHWSSDHNTPSPRTNTPLVLGTNRRVSNKGIKEGNLENNPSFSNPNEPIHSTPSPQEIEGSAPQARDFMAAWNAIPKIRKAQRLTSGRIRTLRARMKEPDFRDGWKEGLSVISRSTFLQGSNDRKWIIDIDWFLKPDSLTKILEGKYGGLESPKIIQMPTIDTQDYLKWLDSEDWGDRMKPEWRDPATAPDTLLSKYREARK